MRPWGRLDRMIAREVRGPFLLGLGGFTTVLLLNVLFLLVRQTIEKRVPAGLLFGFVLSELPRLLLYTFPMAALLAVLVGIGRMASQHEIVALRATGASPWRIARPVLLLALAVALVGLVLGHFLLPLGKRHERRLVREIVRARDLSREITPGLIYDRLPGAPVLYARGAAESPGGRVFRGVLLSQEAPGGDLAGLVLARRGQVWFDRDTGRISLLLEDGERHVWQPLHPETWDRIRYRQMTLTFPPDPAIRALSRDRGRDHQVAVGLELLALARELRAEIATEPREGRRIHLETRLRKTMLEWHRRTALPLAVIALAFAAFPLAATTQRGGRFVGMTQALMIIFVFWVLLSMGWGLSEQGKWPVWLGPWLPDLVAAAWGLYLWVSLARRDATGSGVLAGIVRSVIARFRHREVAPAARGRVSRRPSRRREPGAAWIPLTRLDSYLSAGYARMLLAVLFVLLVLALAVEFNGALEEVDPSLPGLPWRDLLSYVLLSIPGQLKFLLPIATLLGGTVFLAGLARAGEVTAFKACGISPLRIATPLLLLTVGLGAAYGTIQETMVPGLERESRRALDRIRGRTSAEDLATGRRWILGESNHLWGYLDWDPREHALLDATVLVVDFEEARLVERVEAARAVRTDAGHWRFLHGWRRTFLPDGTVRWEPFDELELPFREEAELFGATRSRLLFGKHLADQLSFRDLRRHLKRISQAGYDPSALAVGLHEKLVTPVLPVLFLLVGIPLVISGWARRGTLYGFGISLLLVFGFWSTWAVTTSLGREGVLDPAVAAWGPPLAVGLVGLVLLLRAR